MRVMFLFLVLLLVASSHAAAQTSFCAPTACSGPLTFNTGVSAFNQVLFYEGGQAASDAGFTFNPATNGVTIGGTLFLGAPFDIDRADGLNFLNFRDNGTTDPSSTLGDGLRLYSRGNGAELWYIDESLNTYRIDATLVP